MVEVVGTEEEERTLEALRRRGARLYYHGRADGDCRFGVRVRRRAFVCVVASRRRGPRVGRRGSRVGGLRSRPRVPLRGGERAAGRCDSPDAKRGGSPRRDSRGVRAPPSPREASGRRREGVGGVGRDGGAGQLSRRRRVRVRFARRRRRRRRRRGCARARRGRIARHGRVWFRTRRYGFQAGVPRSRRRRRVSRVRLAAPSRDAPRRFGSRVSSGGGFGTRTSRRRVRSRRRFGIFARAQSGVASRARGSFEVRASVRPGGVGGGDVARRASGDESRPGGFLDVHPEHRRASPGVVGGGERVHPVARRVDDDAVPRRREIRRVHRGGVARGNPGDDDVRGVHRSTRRRVDDGSRRRRRRVIGAGRRRRRRARRGARSGAFARRSSPRSWRSPNKVAPRSPRLNRRGTRPSRRNARDRPSSSSRG